VPHEPPVQNCLECGMTEYEVDLCIDDICIGCHSQMDDGPEEGCVSCVECGLSHYTFETLDGVCTYCHSQTDDHDTDDRNPNRDGAPVTQVSPPATTERTTMYAKLSLAQAASINLARLHADDDTRKLVKKEIFAAVKQAFNIPTHDKVKCETTNVSAADYLVIKNSASGIAYRADSAIPAPAPVAKYWYAVSAVNAYHAIVSYLESDVDIDDLCLNRNATLPDEVAQGGFEDFATDADGTVYVRLDADHFDN
jgi:hypothetical protein